MASTRQGVSAQRPSRYRTGTPVNFRADINGLRAIAVAVVVLFHFRVPGFKGGFVGVDVFFVISGFLMSSIIFGKIESGRFSLWGFYLDRARRIMPALTVMCCAALAAGWFVLFPEDFKALGKHTAAAMIFASNIVFNRDASYFNASPYEMWLLHTWSLSVEWQFYLLFPLVVLGARRLGGGHAARSVLIVLTLASLSLSVYGSSRWPNAAFYLLPTRAWEMLAGGLVFLYPFSAQARQRRVMALSGLVLIAYAVVCFSEADVWPGWLAAVPVAGAALVIGAARSDSRLMSLGPMQWIGKASYSIYLWHWPLVVALFYAGQEHHAGWTIAAIIASIVLGRLSLRFVENPARARKVAAGPAKVPGLPYRLFAAAGAAVACGAAVFFANGVTGTFRQINQGERAAFIALYDKLHKTGLAAAYRPECDFYDGLAKSAREAIDSACTTRRASTTLFLWGDSHAQALSHGLRTILPGGVYQVATSGCMPALTAQTARAPIPNNCDLSNRFALSEIARLKPSTVVLAQRWHHEDTDWNKVADHLHAVGVARVVLVGPLPAWSPSLPLIVARKHWFDESRYMRIPRKLDTQSAANRSRSPAQTGHAFHGKLDTSGVTTRGRG